MRPKDQRLWVYIAGLGLVVAVLWAIVNAYASFHKSTVPPDVAKISQSFDPNLDPDVLADVKKRVPNQ